MIYDRGDFQVNNRYSFNIIGEHGIQIMYTDMDRYLNNLHTNFILKDTFTENFNSAYFTDGDFFPNQQSISGACQRIVYQMDSYRYGGFLKRIRGLVFAIFKLLCTLDIYCYHPVLKSQFRQVWYNKKEIFIKKKFTYQDSSPMTTLPRSLAQLTNLEFLDLENNLFIDIPSCIYQLPQSCIVFLERNPLTENSINELQLNVQQPNYNGPRIHYSSIGLEGGVRESAIEELDAVPFETRLKQWCDKEESLEVLTSEEKEIEILVQDETWQKTIVSHQDFEKIKDECDQIKYAQLNQWNDDGADLVSLQSIFRMNDATIWNPYFVLTKRLLDERLIA